MGIEVELIPEGTDLHKELTAHLPKGVPLLLIMAEAEAVVQAEAAIPAAVIPAEVPAADMETLTAIMGNQGK